VAAQEGDAAAGVRLGLGFFSNRLLPNSSSYGATASAEQVTDVTAQRKLTTSFILQRPSPEGGTPYRQSGPRALDVRMILHPNETKS